MYLGLDYGKKRIGLALGQVYPKGAGVIKNHDKNQVAEELANFCRDNEVSKIILGLPLRSSGEKGTLDEEIRAFAESIHDATGLPVVLEPEGFTSSEAEQILREQKISYDRDSGKIDEMAAVLILEQYLKSENRSGE